MQFDNYSKLFEHVKSSHPLNQAGSGQTHVVKHPKHRKQNNSAMKGLANKHYIFSHKNERYDLLTFFTNIISHLRKRCKRKGALKWYLIVHVVMIRQNPMVLVKTHHLISDLQQHPFCNPKMKTLNTT